MNIATGVCVCINGKEEFCLMKIQYLLPITVVALKRRSEKLNVFCMLCLQAFHRLTYRY